jgi:hypothetical protein
LNLPRGIAVGLVLAKVKEKEVWTEAGAVPTEVPAGALAGGADEAWRPTLWAPTTATVARDERTAVFMRVRRKGWDDRTLWSLFL